MSTAYANCNRSEIDEKFYKTALTGENAIKLAEALDEKTLDKMTPEYVQHNDFRWNFFNKILLIQAH